MGSTISQLSRQDVQIKSQNFTRIYSYIFDFMLKELNMVDILSLNSSDNCKKYIMFMGDALYQFFQKIQLDPNKTDKGTIYFKKIEEMIPKGSAMEQQKISFCRQIAFFYLKLFQIYSALALSVIDQANVITSDPRFKKQMQIQPQIPGARPLRQMGGDQEGIQSFWGTISQRQFNIFDKTDEDGYKHLAISDDTDINLKQTTFIVKKNNTKYQGEYDIKLERIDRATNKYKISIKKIEKNTSNGVFKYTDLRILDSATMINIEEFPAILKDYFNRVINTLENANKQRGNIPYQQQLPYQSYQQQQLTYTGTSQIPTDVRTLLEPFRPMRTQPYCMARALQLLHQDTLQLATSKGAYTSICALRFQEPGIGIIPVRDGLISESMGLKALSTLFFNTLETGTPKLSTDSIVLYKNFLENLEILFEDKRSSSSDPLGGIKSKSPVECQTKKITGVAKTENPKVINHIKNIIQKLYNTQIQHAAAAQKIINKLFEVTSQGNIYLTKAVTEGGIPYLNKIAAEARELLIRYYEQCEGYYALGAYDLLSSQANIQSAY